MTVGRFVKRSVDGPPCLKQPACFPQSLRAASFGTRLLRTRAGPSLLPSKTCYLCPDLRACSSLHPADSSPRSTPQRGAGFIPQEPGSPPLATEGLSRQRRFLNAKPGARRGKNKTPRNGTRTGALSSHPADPRTERIQNPVHGRVPQRPEHPARIAVHRAGMD